MKLPSRTVGTVIGLSIIVALAIAYRAALGSAVGVVLDAGWILVPAFALFLVWNHAGTLAWRDLIVSTSEPGATPPTWRLALARIESQALNLVVPAAGEVARAARISDRRGRLSVALDLAACTVAEFAFAVAALLLHPRFRPTSWLVSILVGLFAFAVALAWAWLPVLAAPLASRFALFARLDRAVLWPFRRAVAWHLLECFLGAGEIWLFARALGISLTAESIVFAAAAVRAATTLGGFVPGQVGVAEGSLVWAMTALGQPPSAGIAVALARRGRQLVVLAAGALVLVASARWRAPSKGQLHAHPVHPAR